MIETKPNVQPNVLLEQLLEKQRESFEQLAEQHTRMIAQQLAITNPPPKKYAWDHFAAIVPLLSAIIIACTGAYFTYSYNLQQLKLQKIQTLEKFFPHLVGDEKSKRAAILAMNSLGDAQLAAKVASIFASEGTASALTSMAKSNSTEDKEIVRDALYKTLDALAEKYNYENNYQNAVETYKKALALKESLAGKDSPDLSQDVGKLADLYEQHGDHQAAAALRTRLAQTKPQPSDTVENAAAAAQEPSPAASSDNRKDAPAATAAKPDTGTEIN